MFTTQYGVVTKDGKSFVHLGNHSVRGTRFRKGQTPVSAGLCLTERDARVMMERFYEVLEHEFDRNSENFRQADISYRDSIMGRKEFRLMETKRDQQFRIARVDMELL